MQNALHLNPTFYNVFQVFLMAMAAMMTWKCMRWYVCDQLRSVSTKKQEEMTRKRPLSLWLFLSQTRLNQRNEWKQMAKRSFLVVVVYAIVVLIQSRLLLYARTGSYVVHPYDYYSMDATGQRMHGDTPSDTREALLQSCRFRNTTTYQIWLSSDNLTPLSTTKTVYIVPYSAHRIVQLDESHLVPSTSQPETSYLRSNASSSVYERILPISDLTMFPYVWNYLLGNHQEMVYETPYRQRHDRLQLEFQVIQSLQELQTLPAGSAMLTVVPGIGNVLHLLQTIDRSDVQVGFVALSREDCNNDANDVDSLRNDARVRFGLMPYGDCALVDGERFSILPLGPSFEHGFPLNAHQTRIPSTQERTYLLNLMVSWTIDKPTRIQAAMAALSVCSTPSVWSWSSASSLLQRPCIIEHNDLLFKTLQKVDDKLGNTNLRWWMSSAPDAYVENLKQSVFTLCPHGKNPEQYRIWEALAVGSIPVIEDWPMDLPVNFHHPSYPRTFKCLPEDIHTVLKQLKAPVLFIRDWQRDLAPLLEYYAAHPVELAALQERVVTWHQTLGQHLHSLLLQRILTRLDLENDNT